MKPPLLIAGPYAAPRCRVGGTLACVLRGDVPVDGLTDAPIPWPCTRYLGAGVPRAPCLMPILTGDLERAIRTESRNAVAYHFGIGKVGITAMRKFLGVGPITAGTRRLKRDHARIRLTTITPRQLARVRAGLAAGKRPIAIEAATGVSRRAIWRIKRGDTFVE